MAQIIRNFKVTTPAGTPKASPLTTALSLDPSEVTEIEIVVPPGPRGLMGFKIAQGGVQFIPYKADDYFVTDGEKKTWGIQGANTSGAWQVISYNAGSFDHTIEVTFLTDLLSVTQGSEQFTPLPLDALQSA